MDILIVEDSVVFKKLIEKYLKKFVLFSNVDSVESFSDIKNLDISKYDLCIVDYMLKDSEGEHIDYLIEKGKKVLVLTKYDIADVDIVNKDKIVNYISKEHTHSLDYLVKFIKRFYKNKDITVLIVDYIKEDRLFQKQILESINLNVIEASNGKEALDIIKEKDIDIVLMNYDLQILYAERFIIELRNYKNMEELPVIIVADRKDENKLIRLFKLEANDFIIKPFLKDELVVRVHNILDMYDQVKFLKNSLDTDPLTKVYNRYFLEHSLESLFGFYPVKSIVMLDIDDFKKINDIYGHQVGDEILFFFANHLKQYIRKGDSIIRYGGEEFIIFMPNTSKNEALVVMSKVKNTLKPYEGIKFTFSAGIADEGDELAEMINIADKRLYKAKKNGKNQIVVK